MSSGSSPVQNAVQGAGLGASFGLLTFGAEQVVHWFLHHPNLRLVEIGQLVPFYLLFPALFGAVLCGIGVRGVTAGLWVWATLTMTVLAGHAYAGLGFAGVPMVVFGLLAFVVVLLFLTRTNDGMRWGALAGAFGYGVGALVVNEASLGMAFSGRRVVLNVALIIMGVALALGVGKGLERMEREPKAGVIAFLLALVLWGIRVVLPNPSNVDLPKQADKSFEGHPVVVVLVDGLRADKLGLFGSDIQTPFLDELGKDSYAFEDAYASSPWPREATASIFTGLSAELHGVDDENPLSPERRTFAEYYEDAGYVGALIVASSDYAPGSGLGQGMAYHAHVSGLAYEPALLATLDMLHIPVLSQRSHPGAERVTDKALEFVDSRTRDGWLLVVQYSDLLGGLDAPDALGEDAGFPPADAYTADLRYVDAQIGRLDEALPPDTWLVVAGTYGVSLGEHEAIETVEPSGAVWQENLRVPILIHRPRNLKPFTVLRNVRTSDVMPTLVNLIGQDMRVGTSGRRLEEVFGLNVANDSDMILSTSTWPVEDAASVRWEQYKLHHADGTFALYDIALDPGETEDLVDDLPNVAQRMSWALPGFERPVADEHSELREVLEERLDDGLDDPIDEESDDLAPGLP
ncbi:MAG: sulfatase-like hydrolase/transferase [Proteobacteria bacterium]|nr:sulfatase-like hydrolase/transferase [Pseudomonadota bacterium]MCP4919280.1 sulfatase-like hydrolase/transferase [Pseudomonadota bacterium]